MGVLRQAGAVAEIPVRAHIIERMRISVARHHAQAVVVASVQRDLQSVVVRPVDVSHLKNIGQIGELRVEGLIGLLAVVSVVDTVIVERSTG